jgi:hypothetical protein
MVHQVVTNQSRASSHAGRLPVPCESVKQNGLTPVLRGTSNDLVESIVGAGEPWRPSRNLVMWGSAKHASWVIAADPAYSSFRRPSGSAARSSRITPGRPKLPHFRKATLPRVSRR